MKIDTISICGSPFVWTLRSEGRLEFLKSNALERRIRLSRRRSTTYYFNSETVEEYNKNTIADIVHESKTIVDIDDMELSGSLEINPRTLSATIFVDSVEAHDNDVDMVIVSMGEDYQFIRSNCHDEVQIINTFREFGKCGCMIAYQRTLINEVGNSEHGYITLMKIEALGPNNEFMHYEVILTPAGIRYIASEIKSKVLIQKLDDIHRKIQQNRRGFFVKLTNPGILCDSLHLLRGDMICLCNPEDESVVHDVINKENYDIMPMTITQEDLDDVDSTERQKLIDRLKDDKCRAIVLYNMAISKSVMKDLRLLYIFKIGETGNLKTIKTN